MKDEVKYIKVNGTQFLVASLNDMTSKEFEETYTGIVFDIKSAKKQVRRYLKK